MARLLRRRQLEPTCLGRLASSRRRRRKDKSGKMLESGNNTCEPWNMLPGRLSRPFQESHFAATPQNDSISSVMLNLPPPWLRALIAVLAQFSTSSPKDLSHGCWLRPNLWRQFHKRHYGLRAVCAGPLHAHGDPRETCGVPDAARNYAANRSARSSRTGSVRMPQLVLTLQLCLYIHVERFVLTPTCLNRS